MDRTEVGALSDRYDERRQEARGRLWTPRAAWMKADIVEWQAQAPPVEILSGCRTVRGKGLLLEPSDVAPARAVPGGRWLMASGGS